jgi:prepilin-type N-terminal cleavage/methylation domain-containing protein
MRADKELRAGFTLIELVVVVMILGILAAIGAPKLLGTSQQAVDNALRQTLSVVRGAIDSFAAEHGGALPGADGQEATFRNDLSAYLRGGEMPTCTVGGARVNDVYMSAGSGLSVPEIESTEGVYSWLYKYETGDFYINCSSISADGVTCYYEF